MSTAIRFSSYPKIDISGSVFYAPLYRPDLGGATFKSVNPGTQITCTPTGTVWGNQGRTFNGTSDVINAGAPATLDITGNSLFACWIKPNSSGENTVGTIMVKGADLANNGFVMEFEGGQLIKWGGYVGSVLKKAQSANPSINYGVWSHIVGGFDGANIQLFINLNQTIGDATTGPFDTHASRVLYLGNRSQGDRTIDGVIGEYLWLNYWPGISWIKQHYQITKGRYV